MPYRLSRRNPTLEADFGKLLDTVFGTFAPAACAPSACAPSREPSKAATLTPALEVIENDGAYLVRAELPGVAPGDIAISVEDGRLTLRGEKKCVSTSAESRTESEPQAQTESEARPTPTPKWSEFRYAVFERTLRLPETVDPERVSASSKDGVLTITLPKRQEAQPKRIDVRVEG